MDQHTFTHLAVTANYYGTGNTEQAAIVSMRDAGGGKQMRTHGYVLYSFCQPVTELEVSPIGGVSWRWTDPDGKRDYVLDESALK